MATSRAEQAERTRQAILGTARTLFAARGYDATSLQHIADALQVTKANIYYYFRTKGDLLEALLQPAADALEALLDAAERQPDPEMRAELLIVGFVDQVVTAHRVLGPLNLGDPAMRRDLAVTRRLDDLAERGLHLLYGDRPAPAEQAAYWLAQDLGPVLRRLGGLPDDELRATLVGLCRRLLSPTPDHLDPLRGTWPDSAAPAAGAESS